MTTAQATRVRGGVDLALVLSMLSRAAKPEPDDDDDEPDELGCAAAAELGKLTVIEAASRVLALMEEEGQRLAQDPRQLALPYVR